MLQTDYWKQALARRITRRGMLQVGAAGIAVAAVGCTGENTSQESRPQTGQPKYGGSLTLVQTGDAPHLDPHTETMNGGYLAAIVYNGLVRFDPTDDPNIQKIVGDLAEAWDISSDGTAYTFKLRKGVKFHNKPPVNGREMVADDVKFSIERIMTDKPEFQRRSFFTAIDRIEVIDKYMVKIVTKTAFAPLLTYLADTWNAIVPKEVVEKDGDLRKTAIGTGPFILEEWDKGVGMTFKKNPDFFIKGCPYLDEIKYVIVPDASSRTAAFRGKQIDAMGIPITDLDSIKQSNPDVKIIEYANVDYQYIRLNTAKKPFDDVRVRRAISLALDRQPFIDMISMGKAKSSGPIPWGIKEWALPPNEFEYMKNDPEKAKKLLAEAGYPSGFKAVATTTSSGSTQYRDMTQISQQQLKSIGIELEVKQLEYGAYLQSQYSKDYEFAAHWGNRYDDIDGYLIEYRSDGGRNFGSWGSKELDALIDKQRATIDRTERKKIVDQIQKILGDEMYTVPLPNWYSYSGVQLYVRDYYPSVHWFNPTRWAAYYTWLDK